MTQFEVVRARRSGAEYVPVVLLALAFGGCDASETVHVTVSDEAPVPRADSGGDMIFLKGAGEAHSTGTVDNINRLDPEVDQWPSEVMHDRAKKVLKPFLAALCGKSEWSEGEAALAPSFRGMSVLRPAELTVVRDGPSARVSRPGHVELELRDPGEAKALCAAVVEPFDGKKCNYFFKFVSVDVESPERFSTATIVHTDGPSKGGVFQQNMEWTVSWVVLADGEHVGIESIVLDHYEEVWLPSTPFAEVQDVVFGGNPSFADELLHGVGEYQHTTDRLLGSTFLGMQGLAVGDADGDGLDDVYVANPPGVPNRLYKHLPDGTAEDVTTQARVGFLENTRGVLMIDIENDGDQDLVMGVASALVRTKNDGKGVFGDIQVRMPESSGMLYSVSAADPDRDGDLDVYACRYYDDGIMFGVPTPYHDADNGNTNIYYRNDDGDFTIATEEVGLDDNNRKFSLASIWEDFDGDGDLDLFVSNDFGRDNLYRNEGGRFRDVGGEAGADDISAGMGTSVSDFDLDGDPDLYITNMFSSAGLRIATQEARFMSGEHQDVHRHYQRHARGNTLLANRGDGTFEDVTDSAGVAVGGWGWGARFVDYDNDGYSDIYSPCGFVTNDDPVDL